MRAEDQRKQIQETQYLQKREDQKNKNQYLLYSTLSLFGVVVGGFIYKRYFSNDTNIKTYFQNIGVSYISALSSIALYKLLKRIFSFFKKKTPEQLAQLVFQLNLKDAKYTEINWVYNTKKKYYQKFSCHNVFYQQKLKDLQIYYKIFLQELQKRA